MIFNVHYFSVAANALLLSVLSLHKQHLHLFSVLRLKYYEYLNIFKSNFLKTYFPKMHSLDVNSILGQKGQCMLLWLVKHNVIIFIANNVHINGSFMIITNTKVEHLNNFR